MLQSESFLQYSKEKCLLQNFGVKNLLIYCRVNILLQYYRVKNPIQYCGVRSLLKYSTAVLRVSCSLQS